MTEKILAIDPSFMTMGVAIYDPESQEFELFTGTFNKCLLWISKKCDLKNTIAVVENPAMVSTTFKIWPLMKEAIEGYARYELWKYLKSNRIPPRMTMAEVQQKFSIGMNYAQKVGENKAAAKYFISLLDDHGVPVIEISPQKRTRVDRLRKKYGNKLALESIAMPTKTTAKDLERLTGYTGRSSEHSRDAILMVYGRPPSWFRKEVDRLARIPDSYPKTTNGNFFILNKGDVQKKDD